MEPWVCRLRRNQLSKCGSGGVPSYSVRVVEVVTEVRRAPSPPKPLLPTWITAVARISYC